MKIVLSFRNLLWALWFVGIAFGCTSIKSVSSQPTVENADQPPEFVGGEDKLYDLISATMKFPQDAVNAGVEGKVLVQFVVLKDGQIVDAMIQKSIHPSLDKEALRIVRAMPPWQPGKKNGTAVNTRYSLSIAFEFK